ncbi:NAD(P)H-binding protein [Spirosoma taeanense]|uniref:NAD(P)H-binding protein n=1 Tax=Spirosoma taeanense TaxID=2735870 RepID=A0A6M5Y476_9BACT|nr:saccharopine dehydrogenase NADP-binding domain-containing protein [Spirosoma taeanense]QJW88214.1 NAD(P)H-binding protein [Spirosoma taeanense]
MATPTFLLYGANGYTARLIIDLAKSLGMKPVLAGRNEAKVKPLADQHGLAYRVADLNDRSALDAILQDVPVVLHCAGPFSQTAAPMMQACLRTRAHYLDITGEIAVFESGMKLDKAAQAQGIQLMSGVGFDVVPTDCMARYLHERLPDATHLQLAFANDGGGLSHGTAQTALEGLGMGGMIRQDGRLRTVPYAHKTLSVNFGDGRLRPCVAIPWGDIATAYWTTRIPTIETFMASSPGQILAAKAGNYLGWLFQNPSVQSFLKRRISTSVTGPDESKRQRAQTHIWGKVRNATGNIAEARLHGPEGYTLTARTSVLIVQKVLSGNWKAGFQTPAGLYGADLVLEVEGVRREDVGV